MPPTKLSLSEIKRRIQQLAGWKVAPNKKTIIQDLSLKDFLSAVDLIKRIARVAERLDHHPDLHLTSYRRLRIELSTHSIGGLSQNDFNLAFQINQLPKALKA